MQFKNERRLEYRIETISDNCRFLYRQINSPVGHIAVFSECGSRHEGNYPEGIAHFIEHMIFKGTTTRKSHNIIAGLENTGCDVNAYTSKEELVLHASFLEEFFPRILQLFCDMLYNSIFPDNEIEKERNVIIDEISSLKDNPSDIIGDEFESLFFQNHPLQRDILGKKVSLKKINRNNLLEFYENVFLPSQKVIVYYGSTSFNKALAHIKKHFAEKKYISESKPLYFKGENVVFKKQKKIHSHQTHVMMGVKGYDLHDSKRNALGLLVNVLGGQSFNSRLNMAIREKKGLSYNIDAYYNIFSDNGYVSVNFSSDNNNVEQIIEITKKEIDKLKKIKIGTLQLHIAKKQLLGQTAIYLDSDTNDMISAGKTLLFTNHIPLFAEIRQNIEKINNGDILHIANEVFQDESMSYLIYYK